MTPLPLSIRAQTCPNPQCVAYGTWVARGVVIHSRRDARFQCTRCGRTWVARRNQLTYRLRSAEPIVSRAITLLEEGVSIRVVARCVEVSPSTIQRWVRRARTAPSPLVTASPRSFTSPVLV